MFVKGFVTVGETRMGGQDEGDDAVQEEDDAEAEEREAGGGRVHDEGVHGEETQVCLLAHNKLS